MSGTANCMSGGINAKYGYYLVQRRGCAVVLPSLAGSGQTFFRTRQHVRTGFGQREGYVHGRADKYVPIYWIAASLGLL